MCVCVNTKKQKEEKVCRSRQRKTLRDGSLAHYAEVTTEEMLWGIHHQSEIGSNKPSQSNV